MAVSSRDPRECWLKTHFLKNEVANSGGSCRTFLLSENLPLIYPEFATSLTLRGTICDKNLQDQHCVLAAGNLL